MVMNGEPGVDFVDYWARPHAYDITTASKAGGKAAKHSGYDGVDTPTWDPAQITINDIGGEGDVGDAGGGPA